MNNLEIKQARTKLNKTQKEFAELLGVGTRAVQTWEDGTRNISKSSLIVLNRIMDEQSSGSDENETITVGEYEVTLKEYDMAFYQNRELILSKCKITSLIIDGEANKKFKKVLEDNNIEVEYVPKGKTTA